MTPRKIEVGDTVRVLAAHDDVPAESIHRQIVGQLGVVFKIHDYEDALELLGFDALYDVRVPPFVSIPLRADEIELVSRPARITD